VVHAHEARLERLERDVQRLEKNVNVTYHAATKFDERAAERSQQAVDDTQARGMSGTVATNESVESFGRTPGARPRRQSSDATVQDVNVAQHRGQPGRAFHHEQSDDGSAMSWHCEAQQVGHRHRPQSPAFWRGRPDWVCDEIYGDDGKHYGDGYNIDPACEEADMEGCMAILRNEMTERFDDAQRQVYELDVRVRDTERVLEDMERSLHDVWMDQCVRQQVNQVGEQMMRLSLLRNQNDDTCKSSGCSGRMEFADELFELHGEVGAISN